MSRCAIMLAVGACCMLAVPSAEAANPWNSFMRVLGYGWSDGYHAHRRHQGIGHPRRRPFPGSPLQHPAASQYFAVPGHSQPHFYPGQDPQLVPQTVAPPAIENVFEDAAGEPLPMNDIPPAAAEDADLLPMGDTLPAADEGAAPQGATQRLPAPNLPPLLPNTDLPTPPQETRYRGLWSR